MNKTGKIVVLFLCLSGIFLQAQDRVGINTENPTEALHINGGMNICKIGSYTDNSEPLSWNPSTKNISKGLPSSDFKVFKYKVRTHQSSGEDAVRLLTNVPVNRFQVVILSYFVRRDDYNPANYNSINARTGMNDIWGADKVMAVPLVFPKEEGGKWTIYADFPGTKLKDTSFGPLVWEFSVLYIPNFLSERELKLEGSVTSQNRLVPGVGYQARPIGGLDDQSRQKIKVLDGDRATYPAVSSSGNDLKMGIGTETPQANLHIKGKVHLEQLGVPTKKVISLRRNKTTGEIIRSKPSGLKPFYALRFDIVTNARAKDANKQDYAVVDTQIKYEDFYFFITDFRLEAQGYDGEVYFLRDQTSGQQQQPFLSVVAYKDTSTRNWKLVVDYINTRPDVAQSQYSRIPLRWEVNVVVFSKDYITDLGEGTYTVDNNFQVSVPAPAALDL